MEPIDMSDDYNFLDVPPLVPIKQTSSSSSYQCLPPLVPIKDAPVIDSPENIKAPTQLPEKSRKRYETVYRTFMEWQSHHNLNSFSETILLTYFKELGEKYKSSSLWATYSILKSMLDLNHNVNMEIYLQLRNFLKVKAVGYLAKKAKTFTPDEILRFINNAPDNIYLATKVALIMGIMGSCRARELHLMKVSDVQDLGLAVIVTVPNFKTKTVRKFTVTGKFYQYCKRYIDLRPANAGSLSFFLNFQKGKCTTQNIGINKFGTMGKQIAKFLKLPTPEMYTAHSFRKSSTNPFQDSCGFFA